MDKLYPHQRDAVNRLRNGSILWGGVGTGKSLTAATYYIEKEAPKAVFVITTAKKRDSLDWEGEFANYGIGKSKDGTVAGILTVDSWNNIGRYRDIVGAFFIFDEQRLVGSGTWVSEFLAISKRNRWILLTGTPGDSWLDYIPVFVANGFFKNRTDFKRQHVIYKPYTKFPSVDRYVGVGKLINLRNQLLVEMPYLRHTTRHVVDIQVDYDKELFDMVVKKRWNVYEKRPLKAVTELFSVMRKVVNSHPERLTKVRELIASHQKLIVFYNFDYELEALRTLASTEMTTVFAEENQYTMNGTQSWQIPKPVSTTSSHLTKEALIPKSNVLVVKQNYQLTKHSGKSISTISSTTSGSMFQIAEWNGHKHEPIPTTDSWVYLVQYTAGAEGWNCIDTNAMIFYSMPYSYKLWHQAHGRIDRLNTPYSDLFYYVLRSDSLIDRAIAKSLKSKKSFNESSYNRAK